MYSRARIDRPNSRYVSIKDHSLSFFPALALCMVSVVFDHFPVPYF